MKKSISAFIVFYILWLVLAGVNQQELIAGAVVSALLAVVVGKLVNYEFGPRTLVTLVKYTFLYIPLFLWKLVLANFQMAKMVLSPTLPIKPGFVVLKTGLKSDIAKLSLANSITLTPGTLSLDIENEEVLIHWVKVEGETEAEHQALISKEFEKTLGGIFE